MLVARLERHFHEQGSWKFRWYPYLLDLLPALQHEHWDLLIVAVPLEEIVASESLLGLLGEISSMVVVSDEYFENEQLLRELGVVSVVPACLDFLQITRSVRKILNHAPVAC